MVEPTPTPNSTPMSQKAGMRVSNRNAPDAGDWPANSPPLPNRWYAKLAMSEATPRKLNAVRHVDHRRNSSATKGLAKNARFGASSWTAMALPQFCCSMSDVMVAIAEAMYRPAAVPRPRRPRRIVHKLLADEIPSKAKPTPALEITIVSLCVERDARNPEPSSPSR